MPELPEVETIRRNLQQGTEQTPGVIGWIVHHGEVLWPRTLAVPAVDKFQCQLPGQVVLDVQRRGKFLIFQLTQDALLVHLRMSGDLWIESAKSPVAPHHRLLVEFTNSYRLAFNDPRKFGRVWLVSDPQQVVGDLGPEPLADDFSASAFYERLHHTRRQLKPLLLDQRFLAGLGNIYADEALHLAGLHPLLPSNRVSQVKAELLWLSIRTVLQEGIRRNGASIDWVYRGGDFQNYFRVYQRTGEPCLVCGTIIERLLIGQRSSHVCPNCQPLGSG
jgi:formamidopyrimidine-DNA glycosylase